jgi:hypothetical protein
LIFSRFFFKHNGCNHTPKATYSARYYSKSFTLYVGGDEVYERSKADRLEAELKPLVGGQLETSGSTSPSANHDAPVIGGSPSVHLAATATSKASPRRLIGVPVRFSLDFAASVLI